MFALHPRLKADTLLLGSLPLSLVLLSRDANYPWVILVPQRADVAEIHQLDAADRGQLMQESCAVAEAMQRVLRADKMNVASLGNLVPQLHLHHVARYAGDAAWPGPVWGQRAPRAYDAQELALRSGSLKSAFVSIEGFAPAESPV